MQSRSIKMLLMPMCLFVPALSTTPAGKPVVQMTGKFLTAPSDGTALPKVTFGTALTLDSGSKHAYLSGAMRNSYEMFFDYMNLNHGGITIAGVKHAIELIMIDDHSSKDEVQWITEYLAHTLKVDFFLAPYSSGLTGVASPIVQDYGAVMVAGGSSQTSVYKDRPNIFGTLPPQSQYLKSPFAMLVSVAEPGATIAVIQEDVEWTKGTCAFAAGFAEQYSFNLVQELTIPEDADRGNAAVAIQDLKATGADILIGCVYRTACHSLLHEAKAQRYSPKAIIFTICVTESDFIEKLGDAGQFVMGPSPWDMRLPIQSAFTTYSTATWAADYLERTGGLPPYQAAAAYGGCVALVAAIEAAGTKNGTKVADELRKMDLSSIYGSLTFDANGQRASLLAVMQTQQATDGQPYMVFPTASAVASIVYPKPDWAAMSCMDTNTEAVSSYGLVNVNGVDECRECSVGSFSTVEEGAAGPKRICKSCPAGKAALYADSRSCFDCVTGKFVSTEGATDCQKCAAGTFANVTGMSSCWNCKAGSAAKDGEPICTNCVAGRFAAEMASSECTRCPLAEYQSEEGAAKCNGCGSTDQTTPFLAAVSKWDCVCKQGFYRQIGHGSPDATECKKCPDGIDTWTYIDGVEI